MNIQQIAERLKQNQVVAYPTEAVFGLGCHPLSELAVAQLLRLKQRPVEKGLILIAPTLDYLQDFIDTRDFSPIHWQRLTATYSHPMTWVVPAKKGIPQFLTGKFERIAIRLCQHEPVKMLCEQTGFALTSTSANLSGLTPCKTAEEVRGQFGEDFPVLDMDIGHARNPSEIRDLFTHQLFRQG